MGQMSNEDAARILDPETSREALAPYPHDYQLILAVTEEACTVAAKVLRDTAWISVKDGLPEKQADVLMLFDHNMAVGFWYDTDEDTTFWCAYTDDEFYTDCDVEPTHWMPLPERTKEV